MGETRNSFLNCQLTGMFAISVLQSYSDLFPAVYNAPAVPGHDPSPARANLTSKRAMRKAEPVNTGEAKLRVKAVSSLSVQGCQMYSVKLSRMSGSLDFHSVPLSDMHVQRFVIDTSGTKEIP